MDNGACSYRRFLAGDEDGLVEIIRDYKDGLILYLCRYVENIHVAEELCEDTFVRLVVKRPRFAGRSSFKTWLYAIGRNLAVDHLRHHPLTLPLAEEEAARVADDEADVVQSYLRDERMRLVHRALARLPRDYRAVLHLRYFEDMKNPQIARVLKKSTRQVENLLYRARLSLRSELEKEGFVYENL